MMMLLMSHDSGASPPVSTTSAHLQVVRSLCTEDRRFTQVCCSFSRAEGPLGGLPDAWVSRGSPVLCRGLAVASLHAAAALEFALAAGTRCCCFLQITAEVAPRGCMRTARDALPREARSLFLAPPSHASMVVTVCVKVLYVTAKHAQHGQLLSALGGVSEDSLLQCAAEYAYQQVMFAVLLLTLLAVGRAAAPASRALSSSQLAAHASTSIDAEREAPLTQQIKLNSSDAPILLISADVPADCSCRLGVRDLQYDSALPAEVAWTQLLATNVILETASVKEYVLDVDCSARSDAARRCRAEPEQLHIFNAAASVAGSDGAVHAAGSGVIEAGIQVLAVPAKSEAADSKDNRNAGVQTSDAAVKACSSRWTAKWAARATLIFATMGLTFATIP